MKRICIVIICLAMFSSLFAVKLNRQYQIPDPRLSVSVPENWSVTEENRGFVCLSQDAIDGVEDYYPQLFIEAIETELDHSSLDLDILMEEAITAYPEILLNQGYLDTKVTRNGQVIVNDLVYQSLLMSSMYGQDEVKVLQYITIDQSNVFILSFFVKGSDFDVNETLFTEILHSVKIGN